MGKKSFLCGLSNDLFMSLERFLYFRLCQSGLLFCVTNCKSAWIRSWVEKTPTLEQEGFVPVGVEVLPLDLCLQLVLLVGQQIDFNEGVWGAREVLGWELLASEHFDGEGRVLEAVAYAKLDPAQLLADGPFAVVILWTWRELRGQQMQWNKYICTRAAAASRVKSSVQGHTFLSDTGTCTQAVTRRSCERRRFFFYELHFYHSILKQLLNGRDRSGIKRAKGVWFSF